MNRRVEYRVVGENNSDENWNQGPISSLHEAKQRAEFLGTRHWNRWSRIQVREIVETDWTDLPEEEANG